MNILCPAVSTAISAYSKFYAYNFSTTGVTILVSTKISIFSRTSTYSIYFSAAIQHWVLQANCMTVTNMPFLFHREMLFEQILLNFELYYTMCLRKTNWSSSLSAPSYAMYCPVVGSPDYQLVIYWDAQTILRLMGMPDSFNWRQAHNMHMPYWIEIITLTEMPIQETVEGGMRSQGLPWKRRQQRKQGEWEQTRPSRQDIHGSASKPKALWCLICPAEVDWVCPRCSETSSATQSRHLTLSSSSFSWKQA